MELLLTQADLDAMPDQLREQLFRHLTGNRAASGRLAPELVPLTADQATALLREVSFHPAGAQLHLVLERLAYTDAARPPAGQRLMDALDEKGAHLGRYLAALNRMTAKVTGRPGARLWDRHKDEDTYTVPAATREHLRDLLSTMKKSGKHEEAQWE